MYYLYFVSLSQGVVDLQAGEARARPGEWLAGHHRFPAEAPQAASVSLACDETAQLFCLVSAAACTS